MEQVLVTGGGGFLGKALVKKLMERDYAVTSFSRHHHKTLAQMGVPQISGDLTDAAAVKQAVKGMQTVFHVAAKPGVWGHYKTYHAVNVTGTEHVIAACLSQGVKRLIYTSSPSVVFDGSDMENADESVPYPKSYLAPYPETKAAAEKLVRQAAQQGLDVIILRPHLIWGPEDNHLLPGILKRAKRLRIVGRTDDRMDTIYVDNAALAHVLAAQKLKENSSLSGNIYFISQDDPVSKWEMVNAFLDAAGLPPVKKRVSAQTAHAAGWCFEKIYTLLGIAAEPPMSRFLAKELATSHWFDISRAKNDLGYVPEISTQEGLRRLKEWLSRNR
ncbi:MAG: NAD-dependent epimerase/dehydratase family protein [Thermodesulfobacteriota bacterium]